MARNRRLLALEVSEQEGTGDMSGCSHHGASWTLDEVAQLRKLAGEGLTAAMIAERLGRTRAGIVKKASCERLSLNPYKPQ